MDENNIKLDTGDFNVIIKTMIESIREQISEYKKENNSRFDKIESKIDNIGSVLSEFNVVEAQFKGHIEDGRFWRGTLVTLGVVALAHIFSFIVAFTIVSSDLKHYKNKLDNYINLNGSAFAEVLKGEHQ